ncbi:hypothetical protein FHS15_003952 [Paenibacillus castaneae]|nr:hypothetical protein [Paenibacillus castaneae]
MKHLNNSRKIARPSDDLIIIDGGSKTFATDVKPGRNR